MSKSKRKKESHPVTCEEGEVIAETIIAVGEHVDVIDESLTEVQNDIVELEGRVKAVEDTLARAKAFEDKPEDKEDKLKLVNTVLGHTITCEDVQYLATAVEQMQTRNHEEWNSMVGELVEYSQRLRAINDRLDLLEAALEQPKRRTLWQMLFGGK